MNHQSKKLSFNKSTFLSLKAELLKKQEEVKGKKQLPQHRVENYKPPPVNRIAPQADKQETLKDRLKEVDTDELEAQRRSKSALEKKAELYAHLSDGAGASQLAGRFLVDFNTKNKEEKSEELHREPSVEPEPTNEEYDDDDDDEWTNFTDCFGRSRRCLKTDFEFYKKRDTEINSILESAVEPADAPKMSAAVETQDQESPGASEKPLLVQKTDAYLQSLRAKWEEKEKEMLEKDRDIHYQDLLFDEARAHGVGYYGFSTDEAARRREQAELARARVDTQRAQQQAAARRADRDALVAARVAAAKARQRQRMGLPPEEPSVNKDEFQLSSLLDFLTEQKKEAAKKAKEEEDRAREKREEERKKLREHYVREWDVGKEGAGGDEKKGFREMSQEEYEEQQRSKRIQEFAPVPGNTYSTYDRTENTFDDKGHIIGNNTISWADVRPNIVPNTQYWESDASGSKQGLYFSSKNESENNKYTNFVKPTEPVPIVNELEEVDERPRKNVRRNNELGAEIEPPPTYEYYGPESKRSRPQKGPDIRESYEQGLRYLQDMESKKNIHKNLDYTLHN